jgi:hypothetical protein
VSPAAPPLPILPKPRTESTDQTPSRAIIPGDDPGDQQPPERRPESDASIDNFSCAVMQEPLAVEQPA